MVLASKYWRSQKVHNNRVRLYARGGQLFSSAGHIKPLLESRGPRFGQKGNDNPKKIGLRGRMLPLLLYALIHYKWGSSPKPTEHAKMKRRYLEWISINFRLISFSICDTSSNFSSSSISWSDDSASARFSSSEIESSRN